MSTPMRNDGWYRGKKVLVMGLGLHGGGLACALWLLRHGATVTVTDLKTADQLAPSLRQCTPAQRRAIRWVLGKHVQSDFTRADIVVKNPGVSAHSPYIVAARRAGAVIENDASLFLRHCRGLVVGITGTRGKSTTSGLVHALLAAGLPKTKVWLAGQSQRPEMAIIDSVGINDIVVVELSSWQLEVTAEHRLAPAIAIVTNVYPDHLNTYPNFAAYARAKEGIFVHQGNNDMTVLNVDNPTTKAMAKRVAASVAWFGLKHFTGRGVRYADGFFVWQDKSTRKRLFAGSAMRLLGEHNKLNMAAALTVAIRFGVSTSVMRRVAATYRGLPGRLEYIRTVKNCLYINDTTATSPDGVIAGITALRQQYPRRRIILIAGGASKNIADNDYRRMAAVVAKYCDGVVVFTGTGSGQVLAGLAPYKRNVHIISEVTSMADALGLAQQLAGNDQAIIALSPGCASFGLFVNEFDRGDQFVKLVNGL